MEKQGVSRKSISSKMLKGSKLSIVLEAIAEEVSAQYVKLGLSHHNLRGKLWPRSCVSNCRSVQGWLASAAS
jgi:hypothetical protein